MRIVAWLIFYGFGLLAMGGFYGLVENAGNDMRMVHQGWLGVVLVAMMFPAHWLLVHYARKALQKEVGMLELAAQICGSP